LNDFPPVGWNQASGCYSGKTIPLILGSTAFERDFQILASNLGLYSREELVQLHNCKFTLELVIAGDIAPTMSKSF